MKKDWQKYKISEILKPAKNYIVLESETKYKLLGLRLEGRGLFVREEKKGIEISANKLNKIREGDFIYSRLFAWKGAFDYVRKEFDGLFVSGEFPTFEIDKKIIDIDFLFYYFNQNKVWIEVEQYCIGVTKASRNRFKEQFFLSMEIELPPLPEQKRIVKIIKSVEAKQQQISELNKEQEREIKNTLYSSYIDIIKDAEYKPMAEVAPLNRRKVEVEPNTVYQEIGVRSFGRGTFEKPSFKGSSLTWQKPYWMKEGDLLFSNIKAWEGAVSLIGKNEDGKVGSHRYITCEPNKDLIRGEFLLYQLLLPAGLDQIGLASLGTADRNRTLSTKRLEAIKVPIPEIDKQTKFENLLNQFNQLKEQSEEREKELTQLIPSLLDKAFKGEL